MKKRAFRSDAFLVVVVLLLVTSIPRATQDRSETPDGNAAGHLVEIGSVGGARSPLGPMRPLVSRYVDGQNDQPTGAPNRPVAMTSSDFDSDGTADLVCLYAGGRISLHRGNAKSVYPALPGTTAAPFLPEARLFQLPATADRIGAGDFDADGDLDLVATQQGAGGLYFLLGDGAGGFEASKTVALHGSLTAWTVGEVNRRDGLADVVVAALDAGEARLLIFESPLGALHAEPETVELPRAAGQILTGLFDEDHVFDLAAATDDGVVIVRGRDRMLYSETVRTAQSSIEKEYLSLESPVRALTLDGRGLGLVVLTADGALSGVDRHRHAPPAAQGAETGSTPALHRLGQIETPLGGSVSLVPVRISGAPDGDLVLAGAGGVRVLAGRDGREATRLVDSTGIVEVMPMRLNGDALDDLVILDLERGVVATATTSPAATFAVTTTADSGPGSLRQALLDANSFPGVDSIVFNIPGTAPHTIMPLSALPGITDPVILDATTQPGFVDRPVVELVGTAIPDTDGLAIGVGGTTIRGLAMYGWRTAILMNASPDSIIEGNFLGLDSTGTAAPGNVSGVFLLTGSDNSLIGGTAPAARNVVSGNLVGIRSDASDLFSVVVAGNFIGTDWTGATGLGNTGEGVNFASYFGVGSTNHTIGGTAPGSGNVISASASSGVEIQGPSASGILVQGNLIGADASGTVSLGNSLGVLVRNSSFHTIGGTTPEARNVIAGSSGSGVMVSLSPASDNLVQGNYIGTDAAGTAALPNVLGVFLTINGNTVGGDVAGAGNVISGNSNNGIEIGSAGADSVIQGNYIGVDATGAVALANRARGVLIAGASNVTVGGVSAGAGNVISGNSQEGIRISGVGAADNVVSGNLIGTDDSGTVALGNGRQGLYITNAANTRIGGFADFESNVISANARNGIEVAGADGTMVQANFIGTDSSGALPLGNAGDGILLLGSPNSTIDNNLIGANALAGIEIVDPLATGNVVRGNLIGLSLFGDDLGNGADGVRIVSADSNIVGPSNIIMFNGGNGVTIIDSLDNGLTENLIANNAGLGIDLDDDGVTPNDVGDGDMGANLRQNFPSLTATSFCGVNLAIEGTLLSGPGTQYFVEFFIVPACDPSGHGEGDQFVGSTVVMTDATGRADFLESFIAFLPSRPQFITATAIDPAGNTSEFSACIAVGDQRPGEMNGLLWDSKQSMQWPALPAADGYRIYRGQPVDLPNLLNNSFDSTLVWTGAANGTGDFFTATPPPGSFTWFIGRGRNSCGEGPPGDATAGPRIHDSAGTSSSCAHDKCVIGALLTATCDPCVNEICAVDPFCCNDSWDNVCVEEVRTICGSLTCSESQGACAHTLCSSGAALVGGCDDPPVTPSCVTEVCAIDPFCCTTSWDDLCVDEVFPICSVTCD